MTVSFLNSEVTTNISSILYTIAYAILKVIGLTVGVFLLWFDVDQYNPTLQSFCTGGNKKINCNAVLGSKHAKLFNGTLSLSLLSFSYFFGTLLFLLIYGFSPTTLSVLGILSFISLPIVLISIYYQTIVIKQWCKFCTTIQGVLIVEIGIAFLGEFYKSQQALDDWYHAEQKDYEVFAKKYPMNSELERQNSKIEAMRKWCDAENITHTPTIFINGYELPKEYSIDDLTEVLQ